MTIERLKLYIELQYTNKNEYQWQYLIKYGYTQKITCKNFEAGGGGKKKKKANN